MKNILRICIPVFILVGIIFLFIPSLKTLGYTLLISVTPILLAYSLLLFKSDNQTISAKHKPLLLKVTTIFLIVFLLFILTRVQHWKGAGLLMMIAIVVSIITLSIGFFYIYSNRKSANLDFTYELILLVYPCLIIASVYIPFDTTPRSSNQYISIITKSNSNLIELNERLLNEEVDSTYFQLEHLKQKVIYESGGLVQSRYGAELVGFYSKINIDEIIDTIFEIENYFEAENWNNLLINCSYAGEIVYLLTQMQNEIILNTACNKGFTQ